MPVAGLVHEAREGKRYGSDCVPRSPRETCALNHSNSIKTSTLAVAALLAVVLLGVPSAARAQQAAAPAAAAVTATTSAAVPAAATPATDPYGFTNWLNATRAQYGLAPVGYDPNLAGWAHVNNTHQNARGMGHHVMGPARRQNSAMGSYGSVPGMWMSSPAHRAALLDPSIRWIGIAGLGAYWTFNAY